MSDDPLILQAHWPGAGVALAGVSIGYAGDTPADAIFGNFNLALHTGDNPEQVMRHRAHFTRAIAASGVQWLDQVHGTHCFCADETTTRTTPRADAVWTTRPGLALAIMTADCVPVVITHRTGKFVAAAHAGWRGLLDGVLVRLLEQLPGTGEDLHAWIGPCISRSHYQVGEEVWRQFDGPLAQFVHMDPTHQGKRHLDLAGIAAYQLQAWEVGQVTLSALCSYADRRFYSHRQATHRGWASTGRMATYVMLR